MAFNYSPKIVTDGLVLYLDAANQYSYPGSGTTWSDISRGGNDGVLTNGPTFSSANGGSIVLDGINDYINQNFYTSTYFTENQSWTIDVSLNIISSESAGNTRGGVLVNQGYQSESNPSGFGLNIINQLYVINMTSGSTGNAVSFQYITPISINYNTNERITAVWDSSTSTAKMYRNGVLENNSTNVSWKWSPRSAGILQRIGTSTQGGWGYYFPMKIYNASLYNKALTDQEILQNYNATKTRFGL